MKITLTTSLISNYHRSRSSRVNNLKTIWPAAYHLSSVDLYFWLVADRNDSIAIIRKINRLVEEISQNEAVEIEKLYLGIKSITERKSYRPLSIISLAIDEDGEMALMSWRGRILLKRHDKTGVLLRHSDGEMTIRMGKLINDDLLVLINDVIDVDNEGVSEILSQNLAAAKNWQEFSFFAQSYLEQEKIGDGEIGLMILQAEKENLDDFSENDLDQPNNLTAHPAVTEEELNTQETAGEEHENSDDSDIAAQNNSSTSKKTGWAKFKALFAKKKKAPQENNDSLIVDSENEVAKIMEDDFENNVETDSENSVEANFEESKSTQNESAHDEPAHDESVN